MSLPNTDVQIELRGGFTLIEIMVVVALVGLLATLAIPGFVRARATSNKSSCLNNLRQIDSAKQQWGLENNKKGADAPTQNDLAPYLKNRVVPNCPANGIYEVGDLSMTPACSIPGHSYY